MHVVIVGAGVSGLSVAYRLQARLPNAVITLLERDTRPGGAAWTLRDQGVQVEIGPNGFLDTKPTTLQLCRDVGLGNQLIHASDAAAKNRYLFLGGRLRMLPNSFGSFLRSDLISWRGKIGLLLERWRRQLPQPRDESITEFAERRAGREVAEVFADALVPGIHAGDPKCLSLPACFPRIAATGREYGSVLKGLARTARQRRAAATANGQPYEGPGKMWSFPGGLRVLSEGLAAALKESPRYGVVVRAVQTNGDPHRPRWTVVGEGNDRWDADALVLACPAHQQTHLLADLDAELAERIGQIPYNRIAVVALGYRKSDISHSLEGFGFIAPQRLRDRKSTRLN